jgi:hypothetical protein
VNFMVVATLCYAFVEPHDEIPGRPACVWQADS